MLRTTFKHGGMIMLAAFIACLCVAVGVLYLVDGKWVGWVWFPIGLVWVFNAGMQGYTRYLDGKLEVRLEELERRNRLFFDRYERLGEIYPGDDQPYA